MADDIPLTDQQVAERLLAARHALGEAAAETTVGDSAMMSARNALALLYLGLLTARPNLDQPPEP